MITIMTFSVTILGCSSAKPAVGRHCSAQLINLSEQYYLIDCGEGTQQRIMECGVSPMQIDNIFVSHLHGDHCYGLFPLISTYGLLGRRTPLHVYAPAPMGELLEQHFRFFDQELDYEVVWHAVDTTKNELIFQNKVLEVWSIPLRHSVATSGYMFREKEPQLNIFPEAIDRYGLDFVQIRAAKRGEDITVGNQTIANGELTYRPHTPRSYAYLSDTNYSAKAALLVKGVDLLYHEATYDDSYRVQAKARGHSTASQAGKCAAKAEAKRLLIGHFSSRYKSFDLLLQEATQQFAATEVAREGCTYTIAEQRYGTKNL